MNKAITAAIVATVMGMGAAADEAHAAPSRLDRIQETGLLVAGYRETAVPFSYLDPNNPAGPVGFGVELTERVLEALKRRLGRNDLRIRWNPATLSTRMPLMISQTLDIICATDTHTRARAEQVDFSLTFFVSETGATVRKDLNRELGQIEDLRSMRVAVPAGTTVAQMVSKVVAGEGGAVLTTPTNRQAMRMVQADKADAFVNGSAILAGELLRLPDADRFRIAELGGAPEPFACMLPEGDDAFRQVVDNVLSDMMKSGAMAALYNKWFNQPIPPYGKAVNLPLNEATKAIYAAPNNAPM